METRPVILMIGTECPPELEEEWSKWYSEEHVPDILKFKGVRKATRYKIVEDTSEIVDDAEGKYPKYIAIYEFENQQALEAYYASPGRVALYEDWVNNWAKRGAEIKWRVRYEPIKTWQK